MQSFQSILLTAKQKEEAKRALLDFYIKVDGHLKKIPEDELKLLQNHLGNIKEIMKVQMDQLEQEKYCLLVTGKCTRTKSQFASRKLARSNISQPMEKR